MIINCADTPSTNEFEADVAVIGAGAMGLALTANLLGSGLSIILLEAGDIQASSFNDAMLEADIIGHSFNGASISGRRRILGGTTSLWGGQFLEFPNNIFEDRPWIGESGWPISKDELTPFYRKIASFAGLNEQEGNLDIWRKQGIIPPSYDSFLLDSEFSRWSPRPDFGKNMKKILQSSKDVELLLNASVSELRLDTYGNIDKLLIRSANGFAASARARVYVLAAGAIESARLLLASNNQDDRGVGNRFGLVGRYFQDHISLPVARIHPRSRRLFHEIYENFLLGATKYSPKLILSDHIQRDEKLLSVGGFFHFPSHGQDGVSALKAIAGQLKRRRKPENLKGLIKTIFANMPESLYLMYALKFEKRIRAKRQGDITLEVHAEQQPDYSSCIKLSRRTDALGMPLAQIDWRVNDRSRTAIIRYVEAVRSEFNRLSIADVELFPGPLDSPHSFQFHLSDVYHQMGTLRMSIDPSAGVVNTNAQMHEVPNLYIAGCSLFPVSGYSNPTFTGLALASRLSHYLNIQLANN